MNENNYTDYNAVNFAENSINNGFTVFPFQGNTYQIPVFAGTYDEDLPRPQLKEIKLTVNKRACNLLQADARFFVHPHAAECTLLTIDLELDVLDSRVADYQLTYLLYRVGMSDALIVQEQKDLFYSSPHEELSLANGSLDAGHYLLVINGIMQNVDNAELMEMVQPGQYVFPFQLLAVGHKLMMPLITRIHGSRPNHLIQPSAFLSSDADFGCTSGRLDIDLECADILPAEAELSAWCYSASWHLMARTEHYISVSAAHRKKLRLHFNSDDIWMTGSYFVVLCINGTPFGKVDFFYKEGRLKDFLFTDLSDSDIEYGVLMQLETAEERRWQTARRFQGMQELAGRLAQKALTGGFNVYCSKQGLHHLRTKVFATIEGDIPFHRKRLAYCLNKLLGLGTQHFRYADCSLWHDDASEAIRLLDDREETLIALTNVYHLLDPDLSPLLDDWLAAATNNQTYFSWVLCDTTQHIDALIAQVPQLGMLFHSDYRFALSPATTADLVFEMQRHILNSSCFLSTEAEQALVQQVSLLHAQGYLTDQIDESCLTGQAATSTEDNKTETTELSALVEKTIIEPFRERLKLGFDPLHPYTSKQMKTLQVCDIQLQAYIQKQCSKGLNEINKSNSDIKVEDSSTAMQQSLLAFQASMSQLNAMVGLKHLKEQLTETCYEVQFEQMRQHWGLPTFSEGIHHMIFTGNPGTGKTTVAKLIGKIYHAMGLLSDGGVICMDRTQLVGEYIGHTENRMKNLLTEAKGKVLFIDEAYTLCDSLDDRKDFGNHVIESLLPILAQPHPDMLVILAGYEHEMERLMQMNQGLKGRFPHHFHFEDYTHEELLQIADDWLAANQFEWSAGARTLLLHHAAEEVSKHDSFFCNARWIKQLLTHGILPALAQRVMQNEVPPTAAQCQCIEIADVQKALEKIQANKIGALKKEPWQQPRRPIGFTAYNETLGQVS